MWEGEKGFSVLSEWCATLLAPPCIRQCRRCSGYFLNHYCILPQPWPLFRASDGLENMPPFDVCEDLQYQSPALPFSAAPEAEPLPTADGVINPEPKGALNHLLESSVHSPSHPWAGTESEHRGSSWPGQKPPLTFARYINNML